MKHNCFSGLFLSEQIQVELETPTGIWLGNNCFRNVSCNLTEPCNWVLEYESVNITL